jgi:hypothetical protein
MQEIPRPENVNDPLPRPLQEKCPLDAEDDKEFWRLVFRNVPEAEVRVQSRLLYRNPGYRTGHKDSVEDV